LNYTQGRDLSRGPFDQLAGSGAEHAPLPAHLKKLEPYSDGLIARPPLGCVECDDARRTKKSAISYQLQHGLLIGRFFA